MSTLPSWTTVSVQPAQRKMTTVAMSSAAVTSMALLPPRSINYVNTAPSALPAEKLKLLSGPVSQSGPYGQMSPGLTSQSQAAMTSPRSSDASCGQRSPDSSSTDPHKRSSFYGQILTQTLLQNNTTPRQTLTQPRDNAASVRSSGVHKGSAGTGFVRVLSSSSGLRPSAEAEVQAVSPLASHPQSPQKSHGFGGVGVSTGGVGVSSGCLVVSPGGAGVPQTTTDSYLGSPSSSSCMTPENFLVTSPRSMTSPTSANPEDSADMDMDMDLQTDTDSVVDNATSPDNKPPSSADTSAPSTATSGKRKRVRKSRAKQQDPQLKVIVKKTRRVRANDRERTRMHGLNDAMDDLRKHLPSDGNAGKLTKIDTLRTASNYIKVLKMMLGEMDKGDDPALWSQDMLSAVNSLYVQPVASPDSTDMSPPPSDFSFDDVTNTHNNLHHNHNNIHNHNHHHNNQMQTSLMTPAAYSGNFQSCALAESFDLGVTSPQLPPELLGPKGGVPVLGDSTNSYGAGYMASQTMPVMPGTSSYPGDMGFGVAGSALGGGYPSVPHSVPQFSGVGGHCVNSQSMFLQSSQCY